MVLLQSGQFLIALAFLPAVVVSGDNCTHNNVGIIGGHKVAIQDVPFMVELHYYSTFYKTLKPFCGGSIIHDRFILTAAHCIYFTNRFNYNPAKKVLIGSDRLDMGELFIDVEKELCHEGFEIALTHNLKYDICLLKLKEAVPFGDKVAKVELPNEDFELEDATLVNVTGFGQISNYESMSNDLLQSTVPILSDECCHELYHEMNITQMCVGTRGHGSYRGDSGGPLTYNGIQVGVVSYGNGSPKRQAGVYTKVTSYLDWINTTINENE